ncbi:MAG: putative methyltransferase, partial [Solirubrobacterales bacterium]|nr:putative methyltransferase [Solirubrobacterales bacterium]
MSTTDTFEADLERLIAYVKRDRGFDFGGYKRATLGRRVQKRMQAVEIERVDDYIDQLEASPDEFEALFDTILINVSSFFRDPPVWEHVAREVVPSILADKPAGGPIRVWSAGCASGEEPFTVAMILAEALGIDAFRERVKIFATDLDEDALSAARQALYPRGRADAVPAPLRERWLAPADHDRVRLHADLRRAVIF